jgi:hypothetical protein
MSNESSLTTLKNMLQNPLPEWREKEYTSFWLNNMQADKHQYVDSCPCQCCQRINTLKTLAGPMPFVENTIVWITKYDGNGWEQAIFLGRDKPDFCDDKVMYNVHTPSGYCSRDIKDIRSYLPI